MKTPTPEQQEALRRFAAHFGRNWKSALRYCWYSGNYPRLDHECDSALLQQVRNELGPRWLSRYRLEK